MRFEQQPHRPLGVEYHRHALGHGLAPQNGNHTVVKQLDARAFPFGGNSHHQPRNRRV
jgi:hypothetical protein